MARQGLNTIHERLLREANAAVARAAGKAAGDHHRPVYHVMPPAQWNNDPNGPLFFNGAYHLFYQLNPYGADSAHKSWGHAVSSDLAHWRHLPIALVPGPRPYDKDGIFSGCCVSNDGVPTIIYTGVRPEAQCIATSRDGMITWTKHPRNPVIPRRPGGLDLHGFRDPFAWREGRTWYVVIGSGIKERGKSKGGTALLYRSSDLVNWTFIGPICVGNPRTSGHNWECPNFFPIGKDKWCLVVSPHGPVLYWTGAYRNHKFTMETKPLRMDLGDVYYAPNCLEDDRGRRIMWGWVREARSRELCIRAGWCGTISLPRVLTLREDGALDMAPAPELKALRGEHRRFDDLEVTPKSANLLRGVRGDTLEILVEFLPGTARRFGLKVRRAPGGKQETLITYHRGRRRLDVDRRQSTTTKGVNRTTVGGVFKLGRGESLTLDVFLDRSVVEIYANGRACLTTRIYPSRADALRLDLFAEGGSVTAKFVDIWRMRSIWR